ncbi:DUF1178 family protein [Novosphingobium colocasiae]|uniref:DUF1178 family protein n=1 Tax=Novosphingobium colocasiae TaxID=1256513 RepID=A0A918PJ26_9SPHN|nr:DUF1178 family protein [Novosphingobium colocasiae]GGZ10742.1 hypothetical protein GCM10011614_27120 [Novosphingobium colocasiae]
MIVYDLACAHGCPRFEGWFRSSDDFDRQLVAGLLCCPACGSASVSKALQAPRLARKGNQLQPVSTPATTPTTSAPEKLPAAPVSGAAPVASGPLPAQAVEMLHKLATMQAEILKHSRDAGPRFAEDARAMHYGEKEAAPIHGQATIEEARELIEEGIEVMPLPFPLVAPDKAN